MTRLLLAAILVSASAGATERSPSAVRVMLENHGSDLMVAASETHVIRLLEPGDRRELELAPGAYRVFNSRTGQSQPFNVPAPSLASDSSELAPLSLAELRDQVGTTEILLPAHQIQEFARNLDAAIARSRSGDAEGAALRIHAAIARARELGKRHLEIRLQFEELGLAVLARRPLQTPSRWPAMTTHEAPRQ
jgi:hypothetical protein